MKGRGFRLFRESLLSLVCFSVLIEMMAGYSISSIMESLRRLPGLLMLLPGLLEIRGNVGTALAQRLGSAYHLGLIGWELGYNEEVRENIKAAVMLSVMASLTLALLVHATYRAMGFELVPLWRLVTLAVGVGFLSAVIQAHLTLLVALISAKRGMDPDNITIPAVTTLNDVLTVVCYVMLIRLMWPP